MNDRPTPETDKALWMTGEPWDEKDEVVCSDFARKLERERDEARRERDEAREGAVKALETGLVYARECLAARDKEFFQASPSERTWYVANALVTVEKDISEMEGLLLFLRKEGGAQ